MFLAYPLWPDDDTATRLRALRRRVRLSVGEDYAARQILSRMMLRPSLLVGYEPGLVPIRDCARMHAPRVPTANASNTWYAVDDAYLWVCIVG